MLVAHLRMQLDPKKDTFLVWPVVPGGLRSLRSMLSQHASDETQVGLDFFSDKASIGIQEPHVDMTATSADLHQLVALKVVHSSPQNLQRAQVYMESAFESSDVAMQVHSILAASLADKRLVVDHEAACLSNHVGVQTMVFSPHAIQLEDLKAGMQEA